LDNKNVCFLFITLLNKLFFSCNFFQSWIVKKIYWKIYIYTTYIYIYIYIYVLINNKLILFQTDFFYSVVGQSFLFLINWIQEMSDFSVISFRYYEYFVYLQTNVTLYITIFLFFFLFVCYRFTKPQTFADCIGNELPLGWEEAYDKHVGAYYINHVNRKFFYSASVIWSRKCRENGQILTIQEVILFGILCHVSVP